MSSVKENKYDTIVFDTAPTGHTLKFLNFPNVLQKGLEKLMALKEKFSGMLNQVSAMFGQDGNKIDQMFQKLE